MDQDLVLQITPLILIVMLWFKVRACNRRIDGLMKTLAGF